MHEYEAGQKQNEHSAGKHAHKLGTFKMALENWKDNE